MKILTDMNSKYWVIRQRVAEMLLVEKNPELDGKLGLGSDNFDKNNNKTRPDKYLKTLQTKSDTFFSSFSGHVFYPVLFTLRLRWKTPIRIWLSLVLMQDSHRTLSVMLDHIIQPGRIISPQSGRSLTIKKHFYSQMIHTYISMVPVWPVFLLALYHRSTL